ncbi:hypothetical protein BIW11_09982 [Tropilaelaps mercedesae]|uniref:Uncharacterized protein n=1 Tax=Tropilaelaps mercedesae TaxID=418985 RepID=A0A1V9XI55_9ACAR|nr:hypothetical protein BIW11_09982 [Tropilaelaps mercedesae]
MTQQVAQFEWHQRANNGTEPLRCAVEIPCTANLEELAFRLVKENGLPFYVKADHGSESDNCVIVSCILPSVDVFPLRAQLSTEFSCRPSSAVDRAQLSTKLSYPHS